MTIHVARQAEPNFPPDEGRTRSLIAGWYVEWSGIVPTLQEVLDFVAPPASVVTAGQRLAAKQLIANGPNTPSGPLHKQPLGKLLRAIADAARDSDNVLRDWMMDLKAAITAPGSTLATIKTAVAAMPNLPEISTAAVLTALASRIDAGTADVPVDG